MLQVPPTRLYLFMYETDSKQLTYIMASSKLCSELGQIYSKSIKITASSLVVYNNYKNIHMKGLQRIVVSDWILLPISEFCGVVTQNLTMLHKIMQNKPRNM